MENIINTFSQKFDLWNLTQKTGIECLQNYIKNDTDNFVKANNIVLEDFSFSRKEQYFIDYNPKNKSFIIRTTYNLTLQTDTLSRKGFYSLDIDNKQNIVDDWLTLE